MVFDDVDPMFGNSKCECLLNSGVASHPLLTAKRTLDGTPKARRNRRVINLLTSLSLTLFFKVAGLADFAIHDESALFRILIRHLTADDGKPVDITKRHTVLIEDELNRTRRNSSVVFHTPQSLFLQWDLYAAVSPQAGGCSVGGVNAKNLHTNLLLP